MARRLKVRKAFPRAAHARTKDALDRDAFEQGAVEASDLANNPVAFAYTCGGIGGMVTSTTVVDVEWLLRLPIGAAGGIGGVFVAHVLLRLFCTARALPVQRDYARQTLALERQQAANSLAATDAMLTTARQRAKTSQLCAELQRRLHEIEQLCPMLGTLPARFAEQQAAGIRPGMGYGYLSTRLPTLAREVQILAQSGGHPELAEQVASVERHVSVEGLQAECEELATVIRAFLDQCRVSASLWD